MKPIHSGKAQKAHLIFFVLEMLYFDGSEWFGGVLFLCWFFSLFLVRKKTIL